MVRILVLLLGPLIQRRLAHYQAAIAAGAGADWPGRPATQGRRPPAATSASWNGSRSSRRSAGSSYRLHGLDGGSTQVLPPVPADPHFPALPPPREPRRRRRIPRWLKWGAFLVLVGLIFRRAVAAVVMAALSASLHLIGLNVHLPHVSFGWPWQSAGSSSHTTNVAV